MKTLSFALLSLGLLSTVGATARAASISLDASSSIKWFDFANNPTSVQIAEGAGVSLAALGSQLYRGESDNHAPSLTEQGQLAGNYSSHFMPADGTGTVKLAWDGSLFATATYFLAKGGNEGSYLWNITGWNGKDDIFLTSPFSLGKSISYIAFFGTSVTSDVPNVPEGGNPALMLMVSVLGLIFIMHRHR